MKTRFGGVSPGRALLLKIRWLVGGLLTIISLLTGTVIYLSLPVSQAAVTETGPAAAQPAPNRHLLIPRERIEAGTMLAAELFRTVAASGSETLDDHAALEGMDRIEGRYARRVLEPGLTFSYADVTAEQPLSELHIPPGFRAVTLALEQRDISGGYVRPQSRVDVLWRYADRAGTKKIATLVGAAKVLSVSPNADPARAPAAKSPVHVTLLVSPRDAKSVELARAEGGLSLALLGGEELLPSRSDFDVMSLPQILKNAGEPEPQVEPVVEGKMSIHDPASGMLREFVLVEGQWKRAARD